MPIQSRFRSGFAVQSTVIFIVLCGISYLILLILDDDGTQHWMNRHRYVLATAAWGWIWGGYLFLGLKVLIKIRLTEQGIELKRLFGPVRKVEYNQVVLTKTNLISSSRSWSNSGYQELKIELSDGSAINISENVYANYADLKAYLYERIISTGSH